jgi:hypothetical protein
MTKAIYRGHFLLRRVDFTPQELSIEFDRPKGQSYQRDLYYGGLGVRGRITGGEDH